MYGTTKRKDILDTFTKNFQARGIDIKIFSVATDSAPAMIGQHHEFVTLVEQKIRCPVIKFLCYIHQDIFVQRFQIQLLMT